MSSDPAHVSEQRDEASDLLTEILADPLLEALSGVLWLYPTAVSYTRTTLFVPACYGYRGIRPDVSTECSLISTGRGPHYLLYPIYVMVQIPR